MSLILFPLNQIQLRFVNLDNLLMSLNWLLPRRRGVKMTRSHFISASSLRWDRRHEKRRDRWSAVAPIRWQCGQSWLANQWWALFPILFASLVGDDHLVFGSSVYFFEALQSARFVDPQVVHLKTDCQRLCPQSKAVSRPLPQGQAEQRQLPTGIPWPSATIISLRPLPPLVFPTAGPFFGHHKATIDKGFFPVDQPAPHL